MPESSIEILGHSVGGVTYRHYAHRDPLAFKAITTLPQPTAFNGLIRGFDGLIRGFDGELSLAKTSSANSTAILLQVDRSSLAIRDG